MIIDNHIWSFAANLSNGIPVVDFIGKSNDNELIKLMKYVHSIAQFDNLREINEATFSLQKITDSPIETFIQYY